MEMIQFFTQTEILSHENYFDFNNHMSMKMELKKCCTLEKKRGVMFLCSIFFKQKRLFPIQYWKCNVNITSLFSSNVDYVCTDPTPVSQIFDSKIGLEMCNNFSSGKTTIAQTYADFGDNA